VIARAKQLTGIAALLCSLVSVPLFGATINVDYVEKSVVFLYTVDPTGNPSIPLGTGFIVLVPLKTRPERAYKLLVTARHIVDPGWAGCANQNSPKMFVRFNKKDFDPSKDATGTEDVDLSGDIAASKLWVVSIDPEVDAAVLLLQGSAVDKYDVQGVRVADFPTPEDVKQIKAGAEIVSAGLLPGASGKKRNYPIFKFGNVSSIPAEPADAPKCGNQSTQSHFVKLWFVAANLAPGNSGSPIYYTPQLFSGGRPFLLGIQSSSFIPWDVAGMIPIEYVYDIIDKLNLKTPICDEMSLSLSRGRRSRNRTNQRRISQSQYRRGRPSRFFAVFEEWEHRIVSCHGSGLDSRA
jgi:hypothetical protein